MFLSLILKVKPNPYLVTHGFIPDLFLFLYSFSSLQCVLARTDWKIENFDLFDCYFLIYVQKAVYQFIVHMFSPVIDNLLFSNLRKSIKIIQERMCHA